MPKLITKPTIIKAAGNKPKLIQEFIGRINSNNSDISIARMTSPEGWQEPAQTPEFDEYTFVINGQLNVECQGQIFVDDVTHPRIGLAATLEATLLVGDPSYLAGLEVLRDFLQQVVFKGQIRFQVNHPAFHLGGFFFS